jgi:hypothetical protein
MSDRAGDVVEWGFELCSLPGIFDDLGYMRPEQHPTANLIAVLLFAGSLAAISAFDARCWARRSRA